MKIKLLSDLHYEFFDSDYLPFIEDNTDTDVLILAGDIGVGHEQVKNVIGLFRKAGYKNIVYVPGNHEYYRQSIEYFDNSMDNAVLYDLGVNFLNPGNVRIGDVTFIGATLWTNFRNDSRNQMYCRGMISDFNRIKDFDTGKARNLFDKHFNYIKALYENTTGKKVIVTHFLPAVECISQRWKEEDVLNTYFANDLGGWIETLKDTTWCFGHAHDSLDIKIGDTRMLCNPYGYHFRETNPEFKQLTFDV